MIRLEIFLMAFANKTHEIHVMLGGCIWLISINLYVGTAITASCKILYLVKADAY